MNKVKVICYLVIFVLPTWFIFNIYIDRFSSSIEIAQKNVYATYNKLEFPKSINHDVYPRIINKHRNSTFYIAGYYKPGYEISKGSIENFYNDKLTSLGWEKVEGNLYRKEKQW